MLELALETYPKTGNWILQRQKIVLMCAYFVCMEMEIFVDEWISVPVHWNNQSRVNLG